VAPGSSDLTPSIDDIRAAQRRIAGVAIRSPLVPFNVQDAPATIYLKLETLQPVGSFKARGAGNALALADERLVRQGIWTASAGNMAQAVAWHARRRGVPCTVIVPEHAPAIKIDAIARLGAAVVKVPVAQWLEVFRTRHFEGMTGVFLHPFSDAGVMAGNGTIGLEIAEDLPEVDAVVIPYGGGGLACGIAAALRALRPRVKIYAAEVDTAAPLAASFAAGRPAAVDYVPSFVDGIGTPSVFPEMWELARRLLDGSIAVPLAGIAAATRLLVERNHVVAEGAGAAPVAAGLTGRAGSGTIVCVVSGGNIDTSTLTTILQGAIP